MWYFSPVKHSDMLIKSEFELEFKLFSVRMAIVSEDYVWNILTHWPPGNVAVILEV